MKSFRYPDFSTGALELRYEEGEVCIYGTPQGLARLAKLCAETSDKLRKRFNTSGSEHTHLEDYEILTGDSLRGTIAVFTNERKAEGT